MPDAHHMHVDTNLPPQELPHANLDIFQRILEPQRRMDTRGTMETLEEAVRVVTSRPAKRAAVNTLLLVVSAVALVVPACIASALFFRNFVPYQVLSKPMYLQYYSAINPYGVVSLASPALKSAQDYDISVTLSMPPSSPNVDRGNFMISLHLLNQDIGAGLLDPVRPLLGDNGKISGQRVLYSARRPALVPYVDPIVSLASRVMFLFYYMLFPNSRVCEMTVLLAERVSFPKGSALPASAYVEVEAGQTIQIYRASLNLTAQLRGLRWLMHHYRLPMHITFTFFFWIFEVLFMGTAWHFWVSATRGPSKDDVYRGRGREGKARLTERGEDNEGDHTSDHPHTFPTYGKQPPLKHEPEIKDEGEDEKVLSELPMGGAEADDEDEGEEEDDERRRPHDSGIGTSYSEEGRGDVRRRASRPAGD